MEDRTEARHPEQSITKDDALTAWYNAIRGRPRMTDEPLDSITVKVPHSRIVAMKRVQKETGMTKSEFVRRAIDNELMAMS